MKFFIPKVLLISLIFFSCRKNDVPVSPSLKGSWKMILVMDNNSNIYTSKPDSVPENVIITFTPQNQDSGIFTGTTSRNQFGPNNYTLGVGQTFSIDALSMTKISESSWGLLFIDNFRKVQKYNLQPHGKLYIISSDKTLTFIKQN